MPSLTIGFAWTHLPCWWETKLFGLQFLDLPAIVHTFVGLYQGGGFRPWIFKYTQKRFEMTGNLVHDGCFRESTSRFILYSHVVFRIVVNHQHLHLKSAFVESLGLRLPCFYAPDHGGVWLVHWSAKFRAQAAKAKEGRKTCNSIKLLFPVTFKHLCWKSVSAGFSYKCRVQVCLMLCDHPHFPVARSKTCVPNSWPLQSNNIWQLQWPSRARSNLQLICQAILGRDKNFPLLHCSQDIGSKYHPNKENYQRNSEKNFFGTVTGYQSPNNLGGHFFRYR